MTILGFIASINNKRNRNQAGGKTILDICVTQAKVQQKMLAKVLIPLPTISTITSMKELCPN